MIQSTEILGVSHPFDALRSLNTAHSTHSIFTSLLQIANILSGGFSYSLNAALSGARRAKDAGMKNAVGIFPVGWMNLLSQSQLYVFPME